MSKKLADMALAYLALIQVIALGTRPMIGVRLQNENHNMGNIASSSQDRR